MNAPDVSESVRSCAGCGATIYPEHLHRGLARWSAGRLLCGYCLGDATPAPTSAPAAATPSAPADTGELPPLTLTDPSDIPESAVEEALHPDYQTPAEQFVMPGSTGAPIVGSSPYATRVRTFHAKLSEGAVTHMESLVNEWLQQHPEVQIKFAHTNVGMWEGKHHEPNLIITIFY